MQQWSQDPRVPTSTDKGENRSPAPAYGKNEGSSDGADKNSFAIRPPAISLPKGGGALKGIDEKFQANAVNGTASLSIPLPFSQTRTGFVPSISLDYNSGSGNSEWGLGWQLNFSAIQRRTDKKLPRYRDALETDGFMFTGAEDLVPVLQKDGGGNWVTDEFTAPTGESVKRYRPRVESGFSRIERIRAAGSSTFYWKVTSRNNMATIYGRSAAARIADPADPDHIFKWLPELSYDDKGNCFEMQYVQEDLKQVPDQLHEAKRFSGDAPFTNTYLKAVLYGNKTPYYSDPTLPYNPAPPADPQYFFEMVVDYGDQDRATPTPAVQQDWPCRIEPFSNYKPGFEIRTYRLCRRILFFHFFAELNDGVNPAPCLIRSLDIDYRYFFNPLATTTEIRNAEVDFIIALQQTGYIRNNAGSYTKKSLPPLEMSYQELNWDQTVQVISPENIANDPVGLGPDYQWLDLFNEGISGILTEQADSWYYKSNLGGGNFSVAEPVIPKPSFNGLSGGTLQLQDLEADGRKSIVCLEGPVKGYFELSDSDEWQPFRPFAGFPNVDLSDPDTKFIDLNGDGTPDLIVSEENVFTWYASKGMDGYEAAERTPKSFDEEKGPALVFWDPLQTIFLADMSADGLTDIVRIRNGEICYWPNLGYGRFGAKITMDEAPVFDLPDLFNASYLRLSDINGTGATDILYLGQDRCKAWLNLGGNAWSEPVGIDPFPSTELPNQLSVIDLLGNGTACIVWSSPLPAYSDSPMRYIDLMGGNKPFIMNGYKNNFGKEVSWEYKSSTEYYLQDKMAGNPWVTKLPFPVQCLSKTSLNDLAAGTYLTSEYSYHHGYYDHPEKEFRGFARVEQMDTESFENFILSGASNITEKDLYQPPVKVVTWFNTGAFLDEQPLLAALEQEYLKGPYEFELPIPDLPAGMTAIEYREACRACKGMALRRETYALDGSTLQGLPYSVETHNCLVQLLQPRSGNRYAVFLVTESEGLALCYERNVNDPRIAHTMNLEIDGFGNVLQSASVVYGRKTTDASLPAEIQNEQAALHIVYTISAVTNDFDQPALFRLPAVAETQTYELTGISPSTGDHFVATDGLASKFSSAAVIAYDDSPNNVSTQKRLIEDLRLIYLSDDLVNPLPFLQLGSLGLPYQQYKLAFTPALVTHLFGAKVDNTMLTGGRYVQLDGINWWIASGISNYLNGGDTIANAQQRFYTPVSVQDPFGNLTLMNFDQYMLMLTGTEDAVHNKATVQRIDYRILQPAITQDMNGDTSEVITDELGRVIATSVYGHEDDGLHGDHPLSEYTIIQPTGLDEVAGNPNKFLQKATSFFYYDPERWIDVAQPVCYAGIARETHESELGEGQTTKVFITVGYSSGLGQNLQTKTGADPGIALQWQAGNLVSVDTTPNMRWIGNGRTILNNKAKPVKQYEPFFSVTYGYETEKELVEIGFTPVLYYDAVGRNIRTEYPIGSLSRAEFDAWKQLTFDEDDTVLDSQWYADRGSPNPASPEPADPQTRAAWLTARFANTPAQAHFDSLGRTIYTVADDGPAGKYATRVVIDIENNQRAVIDPRANTVVQFDYDMLGRKVHQTGMDSGESWTFGDATAKTAYIWDNRNHRFRLEYDVLNRPVRQWLIEDLTLSMNEKLITWTVYGENQPDDTTFNLRGKLFQNFDQSGLGQTTGYDFKGNTKNGFKQLALEYKQVVDWNVANPNLLLDTEIFTGASRFDATSHLVEMDLPDGSKITPLYNNSNLLSQLNVSVNGQPGIIPFIQLIDYDAKGKRNKILYGNNTLTRYEYDEKNYRLTRMLTTRNSGADILQDLNYSFDPVGNITQVADNAQQTIFFNNAAVDPGGRFEYDPLYRLTRALGREHIGQNAASDQFDSDKTQDGGGLRLTLKGDMNAMQNYEELYSYDPVGNMLQLVHNAGKGIFQNKWTKLFSYDAVDNHLAGMQVGPDTTHYAYDPHGNMLNLQNGGYTMGWNYSDQLHQMDLGGGGTAYYVYDGTGQRVRKVIENGNLVKERIYLNAYEIYREIQNGVVQLERETIHIMDNKQRVALVETRTQGSDAGLPFLVRYQYSNHIGSASLELTGDPNNPDLISYEEYYPFGSTSYRATRNQTETAKRYRYTGKERDEESGLYYHGARYYAPWLCRWTAPDPIGTKGGLNLYAYVLNNPVTKLDPNGMWDIDWGDVLEGIGAAVVGIVVGVVVVAAFATGVGEVALALGAAAATAEAITGGIMLTAGVVGVLATIDKVVETARGKTLGGRKLTDKERSHSLGESIAMVGSLGLAKGLKGLRGVPEVPDVDALGGGGKGPAIDTPPGDPTPTDTTNVDTPKVDAPKGDSTGADAPDTKTPDAADTADPAKKPGTYDRFKGWYNKGSANDAAWQKLSPLDKLLFEIGQKALSKENFEGVENKGDTVPDIVARGKELVAKNGWFRSLFGIRPDIALNPKELNTETGKGGLLGTGPTPAVRAFTSNLEQGSGPLDLYDKATAPSPPPPPGPRANKGRSASSALDFDPDLSITKSLSDKPALPQNQEGIIIFRFNNP